MITHLQFTGRPMDAGVHIYVKQEDGKRKILVKKDKAALEDALVAFYNHEEDRLYPTFETAYWQWRELKDLTIKDGTRAKHDTDYKRFFKDDPFCKRRLYEITEAEIEKFIFKKIKELNLCKSAVKTLLCIVKGVFRYAHKNKMNDDDPARDIMRSFFYKQCAERERPLDSVIIPDNDWILLYRQLQEDFQKKPTFMSPYAILFAAFTGVRVGELSVLKWEDIREDCITGGKFILINRSESYNPTDHSYEIRDVKNHKDRIYPVTPQIQDLLDTLKKVQEEHGLLCEWLFPDGSGGHVHKNPIRDCFRNRCKMVGITMRGTHTLRRTLNSDLRISGVSSVMAASLIGNSTFVNDKHYTFDVSNLAEKTKIVESANRKLLERAKKSVLKIV